MRTIRGVDSDILLKGALKLAGKLALFKFLNHFPAGPRASEHSPPCLQTLQLNLLLGSE